MIFGIMDLLMMWCKPCGKYLEGVEVLILKIIP